MIDRCLGSARRVGPARRGALAALLLMVLFLVGCARHIATYQQADYDRTVNLKVESLNLMGKATAPYAQNQAAVENLRLSLDKAYEAAKGMANNQMVTQMWAILKDPNSNLLGGFLTRWQKKSVLSQPFIDEMKGQVGDAFDKIIAVESGKPKS